MNTPVKTLTNLRLDWFWSVTKRVTKLNAHLSNFIGRNLNKRNQRSLLEYSRIDRFQYFIAMEAPPPVHANSPLSIFGFR